MKIQEWADLHDVSRVTAWRHAKNCGIEMLPGRTNGGTELSPQEVKKLDKAWEELKKRKEKERERKKAERKARLSQVCPKCGQKIRATFQKKIKKNVDK